MDLPGAGCFTDIYLLNDVSFKKTKLDPNSDIGSPPWRALDVLRDHITSPLFPSQDQSIHTSFHVYEYSTLQ